MLDKTTKDRIDKARDILVGKVPDPKSQVEQITIALIYKFMDDIDGEAEAFGGNRKFFAGDYERYGWANLVRSGIGGHAALGLYAEAIATMPENPGVPQLFRNIFRNAYLPYRAPETLRAFLKVIDEFTYDHSERLGDAFEYLLSVLGSQGDAGQFRTPRHIIDFIVDLTDPQKHETVLDPACGTAGFLVSSYKHIQEANSGENGHTTLTADDRRRLASNLRGYDISPDMVRLSLVNMYLHGFNNPKIFEYDTLTSEDRWHEHADVILANPPFMTPKGGINPHSRFSAKSRRSEVLFLDYFLEHLTAAGRAGVVVPEGIHFVGHNAHRRLRRKLLDVDDGMLLADVTLPHGVFKPYASVKTHVLIIDRRLARRCDSVLFVEVENDGFKQTDTREPVPGSQLPVAKELITQFKRSVAEGTRWKAPEESKVRAYTVKKKALLEDAGSHLLGRWHDLPKRVVHSGEVKVARLGCLCDFQRGMSPNMGSRPGPFPLVVPAAERKTAERWDFEGPAICIPLISSAGHGKAEIKRLHYQEGRFALAKTMCAAFVRNGIEVNARYLHLWLSAACKEILVPLMRGATNVTLAAERLGDVLVPVPERAVQNEVVESDLLRGPASEILSAAKELRRTSTDPTVLALADRITRDLAAILKPGTNRASVQDFLPKARTRAPHCGK